MQPLEMLLPLILILVAARLAGMASRRIGMPAVLGELLAGLILGPSVLGLVQMNETLEGIAYIGVLLLMFIAGLETDTAQMLKVGKASTFGAIGGVILPFGAGVALGMASGMPAPATLFLAAALTATSVSVSVQVLQEVGQLRSRAGMVILGAAITDDVLGLLALSLVMSFVGQGESIAVTILRLVLFFPIAIIVGRFALGPVVRWIARNHSEEAGIALIVAVVLFYAWSAEAWGGLAAITGAYVAGVMLGRLTEAREWIGKSVSILGHGLFIPVFFVTVGLSTNLQAVLVAPAFAVDRDRRGRGDEGAGFRRRRTPRRLHLGRVPHDRRGDGGTRRGGARRRIARPEQRADLEHGVHADHRDDDGHDAADAAAAQAHPRGPGRGRASARQCDACTGGDRGGWCVRLHHDTFVEPIP